MLVTSELLSKRGANDRAIRLMRSIYPEGATMKQIIEEHFFPDDFLHWCFSYLDISDEEKEEYEKFFGIYNTLGYFKSRRIKDSQYILRSSDIDKSINIVASSRVKNSSLVYNSEDIEDSSRVYKSSICFGSQDVLDSINVTNSRMIVGSTYVVDSNSIKNSKFIENSAGILDSSYIKESYFLSGCFKMRNSIFCSYMDNKEYCLFNKAISQETYENVLMQLQKFVTFPLRMIEKVNHYRATPILNISRLFNDFPANFWKWVKTLPNYDPLLLYGLTFHDGLL